MPAFIEAVLAAAAALASARAGETPAPALRAVEAMGPQAVELARAVAGRAETARPGVAPPEGIPTAAAGAFLLLRAVKDLRLTALARRAEYPAAGAEGAGWFVAALAARWAGLPLGTDPDPGLLALAGLDAPFEFESFRRAWADADGRRARGFQTALARMLLGHRMFGDPARIALAVVPHRGGWAALAGDEAAQVWPFAAPLDAADTPLAEWVEAWQTDWQAITGAPAEVVHIAAPPALAAAVECFTADSVGDPHADVTLAATAQAALRAWARWLPRFGGASTPYLLAQFVRRPGRVFRDDAGLLIELDPRPLDVALQMSGYLDPIEPPPGAGGPVIRFRIGGG